MDESDNDILLVEDLEESTSKPSESPPIPSSETVLDAEISPMDSNSRTSSVLSTMFGSVGVIFNRIIKSIKSTANSASSKAHSIRESRSEKHTRRLAVAETKANQDQMVLVAADIQTYKWEIFGMDCPDCATKANQAISRIDGVESCDVSVMEGTISVSIDLSLTTVSRISRILDSIGFSPDRPWEIIQGITPKMVEENRTIDRRMLRKEIQNVPGILDVQMIDGQIQIKRVSKLHSEMSDDLRQGLFEIIGIEPVLSISEGGNLRPDQWRLLGALATLPILASILLLESQEQLFASQIIAFVSVLLIGWPMLIEAINSLRNGVFAFQILTTAAVIGAMVLQEYSEALMVVGLVAFASHLEEHAIVKARKAMQGGLDRLPQEARLVVEKKLKFGDTISSINPLNMIQSPSTHHVPAESSHMVPVATIQIGDKVEIRSGEVVPIDGRITEGTGHLDRAPLTGESLPVEVSAGTIIEAGLTLTRGPVIVETIVIEDETRLAGLIDMVHTFKERPPKVHSTIATFTEWWVPIVFIFSPVIGLLSYGQSEQALLMTLLLWVVSCPCALLLASPIPHAVALTHASSKGIIARGGDVLEKAARVNLAFLDKTGTLTSGKPRLHSVSIVSGGDRVRISRLAAGLEMRSNHPYANVIIDALEDGQTPMNVSSILDGDAGVTGKLRGKEVRIGRADWLEKSGITIPTDLSTELTGARESGHGVSLLSEDGIAIALFRFVHDDARDGAMELVTSLRESGIEVQILSGDEQKAVESFGESLGIRANQCTGNVSPEDKASYVEKRSISRRTLMAGDGFNDSGALAVADVGIAVGSGDQVNLDAADVLIPGEDPRAVIELTKLARSARRIVQVNIVLSVLLTITLIVCVLMGIELSIAVGVLLHEASALIVILNGMWVAGTGMERVSSVGEIFSEVFKEAIVSINLLLGRNKDTQATL
ncbi:MAG: hypothetical protein CMB31_04555 [Euryarchaeota archaeon]|nr:hypothetical protein [Euryarchaeota archaeon]